MATTLVAMFDDMDEAERARQQLSNAGLSESSVQLTSSSAQSAAPVETGGGQDHRGFFARLFGLDEPDDEVGHYAEAVRRGSGILTVHLDEDDQVQTVNRILEENGAVDIDQRVEQWRAGGYQDYDENAPAYSPEQSQSERQTFQVMQEESQVGKRQLEAGGVRVHRRLMQRPVDEQVAQSSQQMRRYSGPERRMRNVPYPGTERRVSAGMGA